ncbi:MAG: FAD-dependent oxidoreductase [Alphaproteobacteria bacterium]|nr:FAD-dependent oxidoreductase [Alphaproteobacteria bacterium]
MALSPLTKITRREKAAPQRLEADVFVLGAGISGISAALESAALGRRVILADGAPRMGGQAVAALIGTFCGLYSNGPDPYQVTHGIADRILADLGAKGAISPLRGRRNTVVLRYDERALYVWIDEALAAAHVLRLPGALVQRVEIDGRRVRRVGLLTRFGAVDVDATGFVDASGDAVLAWMAGLPCREPATPIFGTQMMVLEGVRGSVESRDIEKRLAERGAAYGLRRKDGFVFVSGGDGTALCNLTHVETPLDPLAAASAALDGRRQAEAALRFLVSEFPGAFGNARIQDIGQVGMRQTRWIVGRHHLTADEVRQGARFPDAVARSSWPIELHNRPDDVHWEEFGDDHMHYVPLGSLIAEGADNLVAAGRCIDGDAAALSAVRVMGPCIATGAAAAHALDLAGTGSVDQIDIAALKTRLRDNLERTD